MPTSEDFSNIPNSGVFRHSHRVVAEEIDGQGHVNNLRYVAWMQDAAVAHSVAVGWPGTRYRQTALAWVVRSHAVEYRKPTYERDEIVIETWISEIRKTACLRQYRMLRGPTAELVAIAETRWVLTDRRSGLPKRLPPELAAAFPLVDENAFPRERT